MACLKATNPGQEAVDSLCLEALTLLGVVYRLALAIAHVRGCAHSSRANSDAPKDALPPYGARRLTCGPTRVFAVRTHLRLDDFRYEASPASAKKAAIDSCVTPRSSLRSARNDSLASRVWLANTVVNVIVQGCS